MIRRRPAVPIMQSVMCRSSGAASHPGDRRRSAFGPEHQHFSGRWGRVRQRTFDALMDRLLSHPPACVSVEARHTRRVAMTSSTAAGDGIIRVRPMDGPADRPAPAATRGAPQRLFGGSSGRSWRIPALTPRIEMAPDRGASATGQTAGQRPISRLARGQLKPGTNRGCRAPEATRRMGSGCSPGSGRA
jgi:hypothetical protein